MNVFVTFGIATSFERNLLLYPVELAIYYSRFSGSFVFFLSITCQRTERNWMRVDIKHSQMILQNVANVRLHVIGKFNVLSINVYPDHF